MSDANPIERARADYRAYREREVDAERRNDLPETNYYRGKADGIARVLGEFGYGVRFGELGESLPERELEASR